MLSEEQEQQFSFASIESSPSCSSYSEVTPSDQSQTLGDDRSLGSFDQQSEFQGSTKSQSSDLTVTEASRLSECKLGFEETTQESCMPDEENEEEAPAPSSPYLKKRERKAAKATPEPSKPDHKPRKSKRLAGQKQEAPKPDYAECSEAESDYDYTPKRHAAKRARRGKKTHPSLAEEENFQTTRVSYQKFDFFEQKYQKTSNDMNERIEEFLQKKDNQYVMNRRQFLNMIQSMKTRFISDLNKYINEKTKARLQDIIDKQVAAVRCPREIDIETLTECALLLKSGKHLVSLDEINMRFPQKYYEYKVKENGKVGMKNLFLEDA